MVYDHYIKETCYIASLTQPSRDCIFYKTKNKPSSLNSSSMSGTPNKRVHDDSGGHPSLSRYTHMTQDDSGAYSGMGPANSKLPNPSAPSEYHAPSFDMGQDSRMPKVPRTEMREMESRRSPMLPMYRTQPSSVNEPQSDHAVNPEESNVRDLKVENRDGKAESRELYQGVKYDKDFRYTHDYKGEYKHEPSAMYPVNNSRSLNWNESKDHHRTWKYPDTSGGNMDSRDVSRSNIGDNVTKEDKDHNVPHETASENKVNDDRLKERDRKRKDVKHREWGENNKETKEPSKEERETDRKELPKEKDKVRDKNEKEGLQNDKEDMDVSSSRVVEQKSSENWKELDKEPKDRKMERDGDNEGEKRNKGFDKDSDDGGVDVEGSADRERDGFNYGVQQRKRMLRPRGSPQVGNRDPRFRSRPQDNDGSTGKDVSTVVYRVGECVQELLKLWKEYESAASDKIPESSNGGPTLEIRIPAEHVCATNRQVKGGQLWGTDVYTDDSDLVAVLMHTGFCRPTASPPPPAIQELRATVRVLPPQNCYISTLRNNVRSRAWGAAIGCSFRVERCHIVKKGGGTIDLEPCLTHTSTVEPTLAPVVVERTMTTRAAASNALRQQRFVREVTLQYNLCNEPWIKYSISAIADKGLKKPLFTSARLKKGEVLYLESRTRRFELCFNGEKVVKAGNEAETHLGNGERSMDIDNNNSNNVTDVFRWSQCKKPLPQTLMLSIGIPLPLEHLEVLEENLDWEDIQWSQTGVWISGKEYPLSRVHFLSR